MTNRLKKQYEKIPFLENIYNAVSKVEYRGVNLWYPLMSPIYHFYEEQTEIENYAPKPSWVRIFSFLFLHEKITVENKQGQIMVSFFINYKDKHLKLFKEYLKGFNEKELVIVKRAGFAFSLPNISKYIKLLKFLKKNGMKECFSSQKQFYYFSGFVYLYMKQVDLLKKVLIGVSPKGYISFNNSVDRNESILTQLMKKNNVPTFNIQHGIVEDWSRFSKDCIIYDAMISDYFLTWGQKSKEIMTKYHSSKSIVPVGNPRYPKINIRGMNKMSRGCFFLSGKLFRESNQRILNQLEGFIAKNPLVKIQIKAHPEDSLDCYSFNKEKLVPIVEDVEVPKILKKSDFIIVHNSTISMEALAYQIPIFQFQDKYSERGFVVDKLIFTDLDSFEKKFKESTNKKDSAALLAYYKKAYYNNFFQPKGKTISENFKEVIYDKIKCTKIKK
jgi:hypothetical protein